MANKRIRLLTGVAAAALVGTAGATGANAATPSAGSGDGHARVAAGVGPAVATATATPSSVAAGGIVTIETSVDFNSDAGQYGTLVSQVESARFGELHPAYGLGPNVLSSTCAFGSHGTLVGDAVGCRYTVRVTGTPGQTINESVTWRYGSFPEKTISAPVTITVLPDSAPRTATAWAWTGTTWPSAKVGTTTLTRSTPISALWPSLPSTCKTALPTLQDGLSHAALPAPCDAYQRLVAAGTAAVLNEAKNPSGYPSSSVPAIVDLVNRTMASGDRSAIVRQAYLYESWNRGR